MPKIPFVTAQINCTDIRNTCVQHESDLAALSEAIGAINLSTVDPSGTIAAAFSTANTSQSAHHDQLNTSLSALVPYVGQGTGGVNPTPDNLSGGTDKPGS